MGADGQGTLAPPVRAVTIGIATPPMELNMPVPDLSAISAVTSSLKATADIAKLMLGIRDEQVIREKAIELTTVVMAAQSGALAAQAAQSELIDRVRDLEKQVVQLEDWNREKQRYQLTQAGSGSFAYATKPGMENGEPPHHICAHCYQDGRKSILQGFARQRSLSASNFLRCDACKAEIVTKTVHAAAPKPPRRTSDWFE